jgi:hypothetical protein
VNPENQLEVVAGLAHIKVEQIDQKGNRTIGKFLNLKRSVGQREGCACGGAGQESLLHIHVPATLVHPCTARNDAE